MLYHYLKLGLPLPDVEFDKIYPPAVRDISKRFWTPVEIAIKASRFLVRNHATKVLDIGSGIGKFCFVGSSVTNGKFIGIEQRDDYIKIAKGTSKVYNIQNVRFIQANIKEINFSKYNSFYFFNPFYENLIRSEGKLYKPELYYEYSDYVKKQLEQLSLGTRVVTYHGSNEEIPLTYDMVSSDCNGYLKFWIKKHKKEEHSLMEGQFIKKGISRIKNLGFASITKDNLFEDEVYKALFEQFLRSQLGHSDIVDDVVLNLLSKINKNF